MSTNNTEITYEYLIPGLGLRYTRHSAGADATLAQGQLRQESTYCARVTPVYSSSPGNHKIFDRFLPVARPQLGARHPMYGSSPREIEFFETLFDALRIASANATFVSANDQQLTGFFALTDLLLAADDVRRLWAETEGGPVVKNIRVCFAQIAPGTLAPMADWQAEISVRVWRPASKPEATPAVAVLPKPLVDRIVLRTISDRSSSGAERGSIR